MNTNKFIAAFIPLAIVSWYAAIQIYFYGVTIDSIVLKSVVLGQFVLGILVYIAKRNIPLFIVTMIPTTVIGIYLTSSPQTQTEIIEMITLLRGAL